MTHQEFLEKYLGGCIDFDGGFGYQCTDLARAYVEWVWGQKTTIFGGNGGAIEAFNLFPDAIGQGGYADKITNDFNNPNLFPQQGDIVIFGSTSQNPYGHIVVADSADSNTIISIDQNAGNGNGDGKGLNAIRKVEHTYRASNFFGDVLGWLHLNTNNTERMFTDSLEQLKQSGTWAKLNPVIQNAFANTHDLVYIGGEITNRDVWLQEKSDKIDALTADEQAQAVNYVKQINQLQGVIQSQKDSYSTLFQDKENALKAQHEAEIKYNDLQKQYSQLPPLFSSGGPLAPIGVYVKDIADKDPSTANGFMDKLKGYANSGAIAVAFSVRAVVLPVVGFFGAQIGLNELQQSNLNGWAGIVVTAGCIVLYPAIKWIENKLKKKAA